MDPLAALFLLNMVFTALALVLEAANFVKDRRRGSRFAAFRVWRIGLLLVASGIVVYLSLVGPTPVYNPMRIAYSLLLIYIVTRGVYELAAD
jgi:hypothetical protein